MDPRRLLIFREVARAGSISAAARALGWTQPAVSQHLAGPGALGRLCRCCCAAPGGVELTEPGRGSSPAPTPSPPQLHMAEEELADLTALRRGRVAPGRLPLGGGDAGAARGRRPADPSPRRRRRAHRGGAARGARPARAGRRRPRAGVRLRRADPSTAAAWSGDRWPRSRSRWSSPPTTRSARGGSRAAPTWPTSPGSSAATRCREHAVPSARRPASSRGSATSATTTWWCRTSSRSAWASRCCRARRWRPTGTPARRPRAGVVPRTYGIVHRPGAERVPATAA